jgi:hypothetical protein
MPCSDVRDVLGSNPTLALFNFFDIFLLNRSDHMVVGSNPTLALFNFFDIFLLNRSDHMVVLCLKPVVGPRFGRFSPVQWRGRSSVLTKPVRLPVPVFPVQSVNWSSF